LHVVRRREVGALSSKMLLQIAMTKIHGISEYGHYGFLLPSAKGVGAYGRGGGLILPRVTYHKTSYRPTEPNK